MRLLVKALSKCSLFLKNQTETSSMTSPSRSFLQNLPLHLPVGIKSRARPCSLIRILYPGGSDAYEIVFGISYGSFNSISSNAISNKDALSRGYTRTKLLFGGNARSISQSQHIGVSHIIIALAKPE